MHVGVCSKHLKKTDTKEAKAGNLFLLNLNYFEVGVFEVSIPDLKYNGAVWALRLWNQWSSFSEVSVGLKSKYYRPTCTTRK